MGFQLLDDGTAASIGLISASAAALFIGTGYIALDTAFSWSGYFDPSLSGDYRNIALYVLYQLLPLICLVVFFVLEAVLVLRVLGEFRPMRTWDSGDQGDFFKLIMYYSIPGRGCPPIRHWPDLPVRDQCSSLRGHKR